MADQQQEMNVVRVGGLDLPPGFRFHPTDNEIVIHYLTNKVRDTNYTCIAIREVDLNKTEPWNLPDEAKHGEKEWYFFYQKDRKYPAGLRANRATKGGYWKAMGKDKEVYNTTKGLVLLVGMKKTLVFYKGRAPRGDKTNWVMHEYRLEGNGKISGPTSPSSSATNAAVAMKASTSTSKDEWVVCRVFDKTSRIKKRTAPAYQATMVGVEIDQNQNNILANPIPMQLPLPMPIPMQFPIVPDFAMDPVPPYYNKINLRMLSMVQPMAGIGGARGLQINDALFGNSIAAPPPMNFYHEMGMGAPVVQMGVEVEASQMGIGATGTQMDIGALGAGGFNVVTPESRPSSMVSQQDEQANATDISSMMSMTGPGSMTTTIEMDGIWKYKY